MPTQKPPGDVALRFAAFAPQQYPTPEAVALAVLAFIDLVATLRNLPRLMCRLLYCQ